MQVRSKGGERTVKLAADERRALTKALQIMVDLSQLCKGELQEQATKAVGAVSVLLLDLNPKEEVE